MKSLSRRFTAFMSPTVLLSLSILMACGSGSSRPTATVAMAVILDGTSQSGGLIAIPDVVQFAFDDVNAGLEKAGGFKGLGFAHSDGNSSETGSATAAGQLATMLVHEGAKILITDNSNNTIAVMKDDYDGDATNDLNVPILCVLCGSSLINDPAAVNPDPLTQAAVRNTKKWTFRMIMASNSTTRGSRGRSTSTRTPTCWARWRTG